MKSLFLLVVLLVPAFGQEIVEPVRVAVAPPHDNQVNRELHRAVSDELRKLKYVILTTKRVDYDLGVIVAPLSPGKTGCVGLVSAMVAVDMDKPDERRMFLHIGPDAKTLARDLVAKLDKEVFHRLSASRDK